MRKRNFRERVRLMQLQAGKYYKTRDGRKAYCIGENVVSEKPDRWAVSIEGDEDFSLADYYPGGSYLGEGESREDLVSEWVDSPEPEKVPLKPEDIPPGSAIKDIGVSETWRLITSISDSEVFYSCGSSEAYHYLKTNCEIKRPGEDWKPCWKEVE